ncbi:MAG: hypothetical protein KDA25_13355 [Phycisphaerales bacterium]|nr:hypothetical protein [Phycisphaerales bacterium]
MHAPDSYDARDAMISLERRLRREAAEELDARPADPARVARIMHAVVAADVRSTRTRPSVAGRSFPVRRAAAALAATIVLSALVVIPRTPTPVTSPPAIVNRPARTGATVLLAALRDINMGETIRATNVDLDLATEWRSLVSDSRRAVAHVLDAPIPPFISTEHRLR